MDFVFDFIVLRITRLEWYSYAELGISTALKSRKISSDLRSSRVWRLKILVVSRKSNLLANTKYRNFLPFPLRRDFRRFIATLRCRNFTFVEFELAKLETVIWFFSAFIEILVEAKTELRWDIR
jgi:hypothetical protein